MLRKDMILPIRKGWDILILFLSSWVISKPSNLFISLLLVNTKFSHQFFSDSKNPLMSIMDGPMMIKLSTYVKTIMPSLMYKHVSISEGFNTRPTRDFFSFCTNRILLSLIRINSYSISRCNAFQNLIQFGRRLGIQLEFSSKYILPYMPVGIVKLPCSQSWIAITMIGEVYKGCVMRKGVIDLVNWISFSWKSVTFLFYLFISFHTSVLQLYILVTLYIRDSHYMRI